MNDFFFQYVLILCNAIGTPQETKYIDIGEPKRWRAKLWLLKSGLSSMCLDRGCAFQTCVPAHTPRFDTHFVCVNPHLLWRRNIM